MRPSMFFGNAVFLLEQALRFRLGSFAGDVLEEREMFDDRIPSFVYLDAEFLRFLFFAAWFVADEDEIRRFGWLFVEKVAVLLEKFSYVFPGKVKRSGDGKAAFRFARFE